MQTTKKKQVTLKSLHLFYAGLGLLPIITLIAAGLLFWAAGDVISHLFVIITLFILSVFFAVVATALSALSFSVTRRIITGLQAEKSELNGKLTIMMEEVTKLRRRIEDQNDYQRKVEHELYLAKEAAESADRSKIELLATMSHEIRTPLNSIVPLLELLQDSKLDEVQCGFVTTALNSSNHLLGIVSKILDFSKIDAGKLEVESIEMDLPELVESVMELMSKSAERRNLELELTIEKDVPAKLMGDQVRVRQVLINLVSNAIKFTQQGKVSVTVSRRSVSLERVNLLFTVKDTGKGMEQATLNRLFNPFTQADVSTARTHGGTGLGLAICKRLVDLMQGKIGVYSYRGRGSLFWFILPMRKPYKGMLDAKRSLKGTRICDEKNFGAQASAKHTEIQRCLDHANNKLKTTKRNRDRINIRNENCLLIGTVLVIEDNSVNLKVVQKMLKRLGLDYRSAADGAEALNMIGTSLYDLILMDCQMPRMDGYETTRRIRQLEQEEDLPHTPIIAMTANAMTGDREKCFDAGMDDYLAKPVIHDTLKNMLNQWLPWHEREEVDAHFPVSTGLKDVFASSSQKKIARQMKTDGDTVIDRKIIDDLHDVMEEDLIELLTLFLDNASRQIEEIAKAIGDQHSEQVTLFAHSLKSGSANVGAIKLSKLAEALEHTAREGQTEAVISGLAAIREAFESVRYELELISEQERP